MTLFAISWLADLRVRAAAFIFTFTQWGQWVVICSGDNRDLWLATHQIRFYFLPKIMAGIVWTASKRMSMQWHAFRCISGIRQVKQFSVVGQCTGRPPKIICLIRVSSLNRRHLIDKNAAWFFPFFKSCILTESHVTKLIFFSLKKSKILASHFSIAYDNFNDIYDDMIPSLYCLPILRDEIRVFVQCSNTARGHNLDFHSGYR